MKAWFFAPDDDRRPRATLLMPCGYDSTAESGWVYVPDALARGYNVLSFEGPGQGEALYGKRLYFRPDFEHVLPRSSTGFPALRRRCVADRAGRPVVRRLSRAARRDRRAPDRRPGLRSGAARHGREAAGGRARRLASPSGSSTPRCGSARTGRSSSAPGWPRTAISDVGAYFDVLRTFTMIDKAAEITCPTLIVEAENDFAGGGWAGPVRQATCPKRIIRLTAAEGADGHCAGLGQQVWAAAVYSWLDGVLTPSRAD